MNSEETVANPDLVTMDNQDDESPTTRTQQNPNDQEQQQQPLLSQNMNILINIIGIGIFLGVTLSSAEYKEQYLSALALTTPILAICKLAHDKGGFDKIPTASMMSRFTVGFVLLLPVIMILCMLWSALINSLFRSSEEKMGSAAKFDLTMINFIIAVVLAEESAKLLLYLVRDKRDEMEKPEYYIYFALSTAFGLTCAEIYFATFFVSQLLHAGEKKELEMSEVIILVVIFTGFLIPMQLIGTYYIGLASARVQMMKKNPFKEFPIPLSLTVIFRSCFLLSLFVIAPSNSGAGIGLAFACYLIFLWIVLRYQNTMPVDYLRATGHLNLFGYGALPSSEDDGSNNNNNNAVDGIDNNNNNNSSSNAPGSTLYNEEEDPTDQQGTYYVDGETSEERRRRLTRIREQEQRMKKLQEENERNHIEVVIPPVVSSLTAQAVVGGNDLNQEQQQQPTSVRTMFDTDTNLNHVIGDEADEGEELQDK